MQPQPSGTSTAIRDLLRIAKVAMPPKLFAEDPRITSATALLARLEGGVSASRAPNVGTRQPSVDITALSSHRAIEESASGISFLTELPWDIAEALVRAGQPHDMPLDPGDALLFVARDWLVGQGYMPATAESLS